MIVDFSLRNNNIVHELIGHWKFTENVSTFTDFEDLTSSDFYDDPEELYSLLSDIVYEGQIFYILSTTNSSPTIGLVENETKNFCVSDSTMHLKTPLKSPADGWGTEADFRNPFLLRSPESQYYNANVPRHLR